MVYVIGVSSGAFGAASTEDRPQLLGLYKKAQYAVTHGVEFVQLDLESVSEFEEPDLENLMKKNIMEKLHIIFGIHSETKAFGVEASELDSALETEYTRAHARVIDILDRAKKIGSKYVLVHSSESDPFPLLALRAQPTELVDFFGRRFDEFLKKNDWLVRWVMDGEGKFLWQEILGRKLDQYLADTEAALKRNYELSVAEEAKATGKALPPNLKELSEEYAREKAKVEKERLEKELLDMVVSKQLHYGPERWAYYIIARYMEVKSDPLWKKIIDSTLDFFVEREKKSNPDANITRQTLLGRKGVKTLYSMDDEGFRGYHELWVPAVSAKYLWGHLNPEKCEDPGHEIKFPDPKPYIKRDYVMPLTLESPMGSRGIEEWLRFYNPLQMYCLAEEINSKAGFPCMQLALDLEHMLSIRLDPELVIKLLPQEGGRIVKVIHAGWPSTLAPAHVPIPLGSEQQQYLYKMYYLLRKKGFGANPKDECFILFERGPFPIQQSIIALKEIAKFLEQDVPPEKLPPEFYGIATGELASEERQRAVVMEHFFDPLEGMISIPEEKYTFLGKAATEKGKGPEQWKKEELT
ncbi:MAG TPA: hypothetical protein VJ343_00010 [archaeon]|nr:hypothetical protein [archaeon]